MSVSIYATHKYTYMRIVFNAISLVALAQPQQVLFLEQ